MNICASSLVDGNMWWTRVRKCSLKRLIIWNLCSCIIFDEQERIIFKIVILLDQRQVFTDIPDLMYPDLMWWVIFCKIDRIILNWDSKRFFLSLYFSLIILSYTMIKIHYINTFFKIFISHIVNDIKFCKHFIKLYFYYVL